MFKYMVSVYGFRRLIRLLLFNPQLHRRHQSGASSVQDQQPPSLSEVRNCETLIKNLPINITESDVTEALSSIGSIIKVEIAVDRSRAEGPYAAVQFSSIRT